MYMYDVKTHSGQRVLNFSHHAFIRKLRILPETTEYQKAAQKSRTVKQNQFLIP